MKPSVRLFHTLALCTFPLYFSHVVAQDDYRARFGHAEMNITCADPARPAFTRGLVQLHSFMWEDARKSFEDAAANDKQCAMAYWGTAMSYYDSLHEPPTDEAVEAARQALNSARSATTASDRERAYIAAADELFKGYPDVPRVERDRNYNRALEQITQKYPDDDEARIFYALSLLALTRRGEDPSLINKAAAILEPMFSKLPEHPGVAHYIIHAYDDSGQRDRGVAAAQRYAGVAPLSTHAQHMPTHIFAGLGYWKESNASNASALEADPRYYHSLMYLVYGHLQLGQWQQARKLVDDLVQFAKTPEAGRPEKRGQHQVTVWLLLETRNWEAAATMPAYSDAALDMAEVFYVRGLGAARTGKIAEANAALASLKDLLSKLNETNDSGMAVSVQLTGIQAKQVEAMIALANKQPDHAIEIMKQATAMEDAPGLNRAPPDAGTGLPAHEVLGEILLEQGHYQEAVEEFTSALKRTPNRLHSHAGIARASAKMGDQAAAKTHYNHVLELLTEADPGFALAAEAKAYLQ